MSIYCRPVFTVLLCAGACATIFALPACERDVNRRRSAIDRAPDELRVLSLNIYRGRLGLEPIAALLRAEAPDIVLLQEVLRPEYAPGLQDQAVVLAEAAGSYRAYSAGVLGRRDEHKYGDPAILSRWPLTNVQFIQRDGGRPYGMQARLDCSGRPLHLISVHCQGTFKWEWEHLVNSVDERSKQAVELVELVDRLEGDVIIGGDFNSAEWMAEGVLMRRHWRDFAEAGGALPTFPAVQPLIRIDHIFGRGAFEATRFRVVDAAVSDHRAVVVDLRRDGL